MDKEIEEFEKLELPVGEKENNVSGNNEKNVEEHKELTIPISR